MKKVLLGAAALLSAAVASGQLLDVTGITAVSLPAGVAVEQAVVSPDGSHVAYTDLRSPGISLLNVSNSTVTPVSRAGIGLDMSFSPDGRTLVYDEVRYDNSRRMVSVHAYTLATGRSAQVVAPTRELQGVAVSNAKVSAVAGGRIESRTLSQAAVAERPVLSIDRGQLCITSGGRTRVLSPLGTTGMSYLWPTLSPDGTRICFYAASMGCYTCRVDGSDVKKIGWLRAASWYDNNTLVGMHDITDGCATTQSEIVACSADGTVRQSLTPACYIAVLPSVADGRIAFSTVEGDLYFINIAK